MQISFKKLNATIVNFYRESSQTNVLQIDKINEIKPGNYPMLNMRKKSLIWLAGIEHLYNKDPGS